MSFSDQDDEITSLLLAWRGGDDAALAELMPRIYGELKKIARHLLHHHQGHDTLQCTALVHEAYLRLTGVNRLDWQDRAHFFAMSARLMRRVLIDHARYLSRHKRGSGEPEVTLDELTPQSLAKAPCLLKVDEALRELANHDSQRAEIVELRFFGGLNRDEIAEVLGISSATVTRRWRSARAWLNEYLVQEVHSP
jgi:RNA polymerase sigma factor (TIGR02999 family)